MDDFELALARLEEAQMLVSCVSDDLRDISDKEISYQLSTVNSDLRDLTKDLKEWINERG